MIRISRDHEFRQAISATWVAVEDLCRQVRGWMSSFDPSHRFVVELLTREALNNAALHGCRFDPSKQITYALRLRPGRVIIAVRDQGGGFDWRTACGQTPARDACCGRGMSILRQYASKLRFSRCGNSLVMIRFFDGECSK
jgi:anti-sigma regulatory factor (Ser/Thr protein kinase)